MTTLPEKSASAPKQERQFSGQDSSDMNVWNAAIPKSVTHADSVTVEVNTKIWNQIYKAAGLSTADENKKRMLRMWVYVTGVLNGTSRAGDYASTDKLADGTVVECAIIPRAAGRNLRKFYRANMLESYTALKSTGVMEEYPRFIKKAESRGINAEDAFAMADWMDDCPMFTPNERRAHDKSFVIAISGARRARGGQSLEDVEDGNLIAATRVNGPAESSQTGPFVDFD